MIWQELFDYLGERGCKHDHSNTKAFCEKNNIHFDELEPIISSLGGCCCDCEVYLNVGMNVDHNSEIPLVKYEKGIREEYRDGGECKMSEHELIVTCLHLDLGIHNHKQGIDDDCIYKKVLCSNCQVLESEFSWDFIKPFLNIVCKGCLKNE